MRIKSKACVVAIALVGLFSACDGSSAGSSCGPQNCGGCCSAEGICLPGVAPSACGRAGMACASCSSGQCNSSTGSCEGEGVCDSTTCPQGCCTANGGCVSPGSYPYACGVGGQACQSCAPDQQCLQGSCVDATAPPAGCNAQNCSGCCQGDQCVLQPGNAACGLGGVACQACGGNQVCFNGACVDQAPPACTQCDASQCCLAGQCETIGGRICGKAGGVCSVCSGDQQCDLSSGSCVDPVQVAGSYRVCLEMAQRNCTAGTSCASWGTPITIEAGSFDTDTSTHAYGEGVTTATPSGGVLRAFFNASSGCFEEPIPSTTLLRSWFSVWRCPLGHGTCWMDRHELGICQESPTAQDLANGYWQPQECDPLGIAWDPDLVVTEMFVRFYPP